MNREGHEFDQVGLASRVRVRVRQGLALFQEALSKVLHGAGDHEPSIGQIEALRNGAGKSRASTTYHLARRAWKMKRHVVAKHMPHHNFVLV